MVIISAVNQKGGVGKTTLIFHLAYLLAKEFRTLVIDLDPQAALTAAYGIDIDTLETGIDDVLESYALRISKGKRVRILDVAKEVEWGGSKLILVPSREFLEKLNVTLSNVFGRERVLAKALEDLDGFDVVLIDTQPTFSLLTINAMVASDYILVPVRTTYLSLHGLTLLLDMVKLIQEDLNPKLKILGFIPFEHEKKLVSARKNLERLKEFEDLVKIYPPVPKSSSFEKSLEEKKSLTSYNQKTAKEALKVFEKVIEDIRKIVRSDGNGYSG